METIIVTYTLLDRTVMRNPANNTLLGHNRKSNGSVGVPDSLQTVAHPFSLL